LTLPHRRQTMRGGRSVAVLIGSFYAGAHVQVPLGELLLKLATAVP
jgi:hypothetical protein